MSGVVVGPVGVVGGVVGGVEGGVLGGQLGGAMAVHWSQVEVRRRVMPRYPAAARQMNMGNVDCRVRFFIDERGRPYDILVEACPRIFEPDTLDAARRWRFRPLEDELGVKHKAQFVLTIKYQLHN